MIKKTENIIVGISIGDLNGIGGEIILKTFEDNRMLELCTPIIFANVKTLSFIKRKSESNITIHGIDRLDQIVHGKINTFNLWSETVAINFGENDSKIGDYAVKSFISATKALKENKIDVLVTAPMNKYNIQSNTFQFPGHTNYLEKELEGNALMMMIKENLRIGLITDHIPLNKVVSFLSKDLILKKIEIIEQSLIQDFNITKPKIAVLGLNPHCGDGGIIGKEDDELIKPVLKKMTENGKLIFGPFAADSFFGSNQYKKYDAIVASYHDQGLIPFKTLSFGEGVNYTAGLNKIRTSPDHGTAFDIAGKGIANHNSFREAIYLSIDIYRSRNMYQEINKNPLKISEKNKT